MTISERLISAVNSKKHYCVLYISPATKKELDSDIAKTIGFHERCGSNFFMGIPVEVSASIPDDPGFLVLRRSEYDIEMAKMISEVRSILMRDRVWDSEGFKYPGGSTHKMRSIAKAVGLDVAHKYKQAED